MKSTAKAPEAFMNVGSVTDAPLKVQHKYHPLLYLVDASAIGAVDGAAGAGLDAAHEGKEVLAGAQLP